MEYLTKLITNILIWLIGIGFVWLWAWMFNPEFKSGTIWFFAVLFSGISSTLSEVRTDLAKVSR